MRCYKISKFALCCDYDVVCLCLIYVWLIMKYLGLGAALILGTFTEIMECMMISTRYKKPVMLILTISSRFGYIIGSLIGGKLTDYIGMNETFLIFAAVLMLYSPVLISLLRETNHNNMLLIENESSDDNDNDNNDEYDIFHKRMKQQKRHFIASKVQMVDSD